jgi:hypothetical protein
VVESAAASVRLTFAESLREYVLSAEVIRGGAREVYLASARREPARAAAAAVTLERRLIWEQEAPVLDVLAAGALVYVLEPARLAAYRNRQLLSGIVLGPLPPARDPRGRLELAGDTIVARFPFVTCRAPLGLESAVCTAAEPQAQTGAVESAAADTPCGRYTLLTRPTDPTEPDAIQAYDASGKAAGDPAEFSGPVTALWPGSEGITAISRNLRTGNYGAFRITIACGP